VIPLFEEQLVNNLPITVTEPEMTRFMMTLEDAVNLVLYAFEHGNSGDIFVQKSPSSTIGELASAMKKIYSNSSSEINIIGARHAEKLYETLLAREEFSVAEDLGDYFKVAADNRDLNYNKYFTEGKGSIANIKEYNSHNTNRLSEQQLISLLNKIGYQG
jgi:UDP-glucose 4-epimerase